MRLPYFDTLIGWLEEGHAEAGIAFGKHVHWGYWADPASADLSAGDFAAAAERLSRRVTDAAGISAGMRVLDVGCGFGGTLESLDQRLRGLDGVGLNIDSRQLQRARQRWRVGPDNRLRWVQSDACALPFADQSFDRVLAVECIFHFPDRRRFFHEAFRVLKPGGRLALSDFVPLAGWGPWMRLAAIWLATRGFYGRCQVHWTRLDYHRLGTGVGFRLLVDEDITRHTLPTYDFLRAFSRRNGMTAPSAMLETLFAEYASRAGALRYRILSFGKPDRRAPFPRHPAIG